MATATKTTRSELYLVQINDWNWSFTYSSDSAEVPPKGPSDLRYLELGGGLLQPKVDGISSVQLTVIFDPTLDGDDPRESPPVGRLDVEGRLLRGLFPLPNNVASSLLTVLAAGKLRFATMNGTPVARRTAKIWTIRFGSQPDMRDNQDSS